VAGDNLAWSPGAHEFRFGTNTRIFRLNDYDFGEGSVPTVSYTTLPQFIYGVASTATETFPTTPNEPFNFLNLDFYAQDTWKVTPKLTWTIGIRDTYNSNPLNPHQQIGRLTGSFDSISHDVNQPLNAVIQAHLGNLFSSTPVAILQPRTAIAWQFAPNTVLRSGFGIFSDIMPGSIADVIGNNPPYVKTFQGGLLGTVGGTAIAPGVPNSAVDVGNNTFKYNLGSEDREGRQDSTVSVFTRDANGTLRHFYTAHPRMAPDIQERGIDLLTPIWHFMDLTPQGRGSWYASLAYGTKAA
jgi:hypothetical protein